MRSLVLVLPLLFLCCSVGMSQGPVLGINKLDKLSDDERAFLRKGFNLPDSAPIVELKSRTASGDFNAPLRVNLDSIVDPNIREGVANWITIWNEKEEPKSGRIEVVPDSLQASVTLVNYLRPLPQSDFLSAMTWTDDEGKVHRLVPIYSYLMIRKSDGLDILWRKVSLTNPANYEFLVKLLTNELKQLMKERLKNAKTR